MAKTLSGGNLARLMLVDHHTSLLKFQTRLYDNYQRRVHCILFPGQSHQEKARLIGCVRNKAFLFYLPWLE
jgi:hypothetical protein